MAGNQKAGPSEELHATTKFVRKETGQASGDNDHQSTIANNQPEDTTINSIELVKSTMDLEASKTSPLHQTRWPRIPTVPDILRYSKDLKKHFKPRMISVGPYHHENPELKPAEMLKVTLMNHFIQDSGQEIQSLYNMILREISGIGDCYSEKEYDDYELAHMMLVDGCSLLCFIGYITEGKLMPLNINYRTAMIIIQDLFLLENQLPFRVLESSERKKVIMQAIETFVSFITETKPLDVKLVAEEEKPSHLLDLKRRRLLGKLRTTQSRNGGFFLYKNVKELMATGIQFKPSKTRELRDISFISLAVEFDSHEMCPAMTPDSGITSYVPLLASLIHNSEDIKELESAGVLQNFLGSSEELAQFFDYISVNLAVQDFDVCSDIMTDIGEHVRRHHSNRMHYSQRLYIWMTQLRDSYFSCPWAIIALLAATLVLFLTGVQTYFTVFPRST